MFFPDVQDSYLQTSLHILKITSSLDKYFTIPSNTMTTPKKWRSTTRLQGKDDKHRTIQVSEGGLEKDNSYMWRLFTILKDAASWLGDTHFTLFLLHCCVPMGINTHSARTHTHTRTHTRTHARTHTHTHTHTHNIQGFYFFKSTGKWNISIYLCHTQPCTSRTHKSANLKIQNVSKNLLLNHTSEILKLSNKK